MVVANWGGRGLLQAGLVRDRWVRRASGMVGSVGGGLFVVYRHKLLFAG